MRCGAASTTAVPLVATMSVELVFGCDLRAAGMSCSDATRRAGNRGSDLACRLVIHLCRRLTAAAQAHVDIGKTGIPIGTTLSCVVFLIRLCRRHPNSRVS
ncbi:hypothetical protein BC567DRAFT_91466 [Phyllosticta citribraziliensis]